MYMHVYRYRYMYMYIYVYTIAYTLIASPAIIEVDLVAN
jgi:hypothetical protein